MAEPWSAVPEWVAKAEGDWEVVDILLSRNSPCLRDSIVFHAQQCVEKLLKARLIQLGQPVDKIHDLAVLSRLLLDAWAEARLDVQGSDVLDTRLSGS